MTVVESPRIGFDRKAAREQFNDYRRWKLDPGAYEKKTTLTAEEVGKLETLLKTTFAEDVGSSELSKEGAQITDDDLKLAHRINNEMLGLVEAVIPDPTRRSWNESTFQHVTQVEATAWELAIRMGLDENTIRAKAAMHDMGRAVSNHPVAHLFAGRDILGALGFSNTFQRTAIAHGEAGVGAYMYGVNGKTWPDINANPDLLNNAINALPIEEVVVAVADMSKSSSVIDGKYVNKIADSFDGLASAAKRRLETKLGEPDDSVLADLGSKNPEVRQQAMDTLRSLGATEQNVNQMAMYYGWMAALRGRIETEYGVQFGGEDGVIESAKKRYEVMMEDY